ncbi:MAG: STT3 domain-containing protein [Candidatus Aenigmatarchaeota archaeon]
MPPSTDSAGPRKEHAGKAAKKLARMKESLSPGALASAAARYWWVFCIIAIMVFTFWSWALPARYGELLGLDEFYMYRMSEYVMTHNFQIPAIDYMRYWPDGAIPANVDYTVQYYIPIVFYYIFTFLGMNMNFFSFALLFPALSGAFSVLVMFLLGTEIFNDKRAGLLSAVFLATAVGYISRTSGALYEKECVGGPLILLFFYLFVKSYKKGSIALGIAAGVALGLASTSWGGTMIVYYVVPTFMILQLLSGKCSTPMMKAATPSLLIGVAFQQFFVFTDGLFNFDEMLVYLSLSLLAARYLVERYGIVKKENLQYFVPGVLAAAVVFVLIGSMFSDYLWGLIGTLMNFFIMQKGVMGTTVAEQMPGDWNEIVSRFDIGYSLSTFPQLSGFSAIFSLWFLMLAGCAFLLYATLKKRTPVYLLPAFAISMIAYFITPIASIFLIFGWVIALTFLSKNFDHSQDLKILVALWLMFSAATVFFMVRLVFFVAPPAALAAAFLITRGSDTVMRSPHAARYTLKSLPKEIPLVSLLVITFVALLLLTNILAAYTFCNSAGPMFNSYWKDAMNYMATQTPVNSSILSWWDFGYWFQTRGQRPSIADGGNSNGTVNEQISHWFTAPSTNWTDHLYFMRGKDVKYILMDYSLPGKYGAISKIASGGKSIIGMLQFQQTGSYPQDNKTIIEYTAGQYVIWLPINNQGGIAGQPVFMVTNGEQYIGRTYISDLCTTSGIIHIESPDGAQTMPGCITIAAYGLFYIPPEAEFTIFTNLMFMDGYGMPDLTKVFDNQLIKIYKLEINETVAG